METIVGASYALKINVIKALIALTSLTQESLPQWLSGLLGLEPSGVETFTRNWDWSSTVKGRALLSVSEAYVKMILRSRLVPDFAERVGYGDVCCQNEGHTTLDDSHKNRVIIHSRRNDTSANSVYPVSDSGDCYQTPTGWP